MPAPVPGLVDDAVRIAARIAEPEAEVAGAAVQPGEGRRRFEAFFRRRLARRADVERMAAVVFAEAGRGVDREDLRDRQAARQLPREDAQLVVVAAVAGNGLERDALGARLRLHAAPGARGTLAQPERAAVAVEPRELQPRRFGDERQAAVVGIAGGIQAQRRQPRLEAGQRQVISPGSGAVCAYDPKTGAELWRVRYGEGYSVVPR